MRTGTVHIYPSTEERLLLVGVSLPAYGHSIQPPNRADFAQRVTMSNGDVRLIVYVYVEPVSTDFLRTLARMIVADEINFDWRKKETHVRS